VDLWNSHALRIGGVVRGVRYNVYKDLLITIEKGASVPFADTRLEGIACPDHLLETWLAIARATHLNKNGKASANLQRVSTKSRVDQALRSAQTAVFGVREEYRIAWHVLLDIATSTSLPEPSCPATPYPCWKVPCSEALGYVRWDCNRWLAPIEYLNVGCRLQLSGKYHKCHSQFICVFL
jgi:hypothetical protein